MLMFKGFVSRNFWMNPPKAARITSNIVKKEINFYESNTHQLSHGAEYNMTNIFRVFGIYFTSDEGNTCHITRGCRTITSLWLAQKWIQFRFSTVRGCAFYFVEIQSAFWLYLQNGLEFLIKFCSSHPSFNRNIFRSLHLKFKTSAHAYIAITYYFVLFTNFLTRYEF